MKNNEISAPGPVDIEDPKSPNSPEKSEDIKILVYNKALEALADSFGVTNLSTIEARRLMIEVERCLQEREEQDRAFESRSESTEVRKFNTFAPYWEAVYRWLDNLYGFNIDVLTPFRKDIIYDDTTGEKFEFFYGLKTPESAPAHEGEVRSAREISRLRRFNHKIRIQTEYPEELREQIRKARDEAHLI